jgi:hypothetical protein
MTDVRPRVQLHDVHVEGAAAPAAIQAAIERAVADAGLLSARDRGTKLEALVRAAVAREVRADPGSGLT